MNYDVNMVEEVARLDAIRSGQKRLLFLAPVVAIVGLVLVFWFIPETFSGINFQFPNDDVQATEQATQARRLSTETATPNIALSSPTAADNSSIVPTITPVNTLDAVSATQESRSWSVQNAIRGNR